MREERQIHEQMQRLYQAAKKLKGIEKKADLGRLLDVSDQNLNGWEKRGISEGGLLTAQIVLGCDAVWLRDGTGDMVKGGGSVRDGLTASEITELITLYEQADSEGRGDVMKMARAMAKLANSARARSGGN